MIRIIDGVAYESNPADWYRLRAIEFGNGHFETTAVRGLDWVEQEWSQIAIENYLLAKDRDDLERQAEKAEQSARAAARRAQKRVRLGCKAMGVTTLCTLTYRALEVDLSQVKRDLKEFNRRVLQVWPGFRFVATFEKQKRGAWHMHLACPSIPQMMCPRGHAVKVRSYVLLRAIWMRVVKDRGGNFDASRRKATSRKGPAQIAAYVSKYMLKDYAQGQKWSNRYSIYGPCDIPLVIDLGVVPDLNQALDALYAIGLGFGVIRTARLTRWQDAFYLDVEPNLRIM
jgi:hypothetical protein